VPHRQARGQIVEHADVFALDLHRALVEQLPEALSSLSPAPLTQGSLAVLGVERGVYQLFERGQPVYVGKSEEPLATRLDQHCRRCSGRRNIDVADMSFRCLYVDAFVDAAAPERMLIERYQEGGLAPWNNDVGFAPKDVGRNRDGGRPGTWFLDHPVAYDAVLTLSQGGRRLPMEDALRVIRTAVPFDLFRYASRKSREPRDRMDAESDYPGSQVDVPVGGTSVLNHVRAIVEGLPIGWQATVLPQGVILYKEIREYTYALAGWRKTRDGVETVAQAVH
jgi:hypothetical protein